MTFESWRITFQSGEQAARAAFARVQELEREVYSLKADNAYLTARLKKQVEETA
ncbi:hypothetical protein [Massilia endophytica]|uniref:hypothetical protein n=1 Tax=Massilia endophytica TaxID=2899220 RepID=UPI001E4C88A1|nr:hypothetical protein [Massilia endophytica]UGQ45104.1 hypothetical protein LSQ66_15025 [Massilia endophytica]